MDLDILELRQSITAWRDQTVLDCAEILNRAAISACELFEERLHNAGPIDIMWDPSAYAASEIDQSMNLQSAELLVERLSQAGSELAQLNGKFRGLGDALAQTAALTWKNHKITPGLPSAAAIGEPTPKLESNRLAGLRNSAVELGNRAADMLSQAAETASRTIKDRTILHNRIRSAASKRLNDHWMSFSGNPRAVLAEVSLMVDETAAQARMMQ